MMKKGEDIYDLIWWSYNLIFQDTELNEETKIMCIRSKQKGKYEGKRTTFLNICAKWNIGNKPRSNEIGYL